MYQRVRFSTLTFGLGIVLGGLLTHFGPSLRSLEASRPLDPDASQFASGPIAIQQHPTLKLPLPQDALYILDYRKGRLLASVPSFKQTGFDSPERTSVLGAFSSRDLIADFRLPPGITPNFLMQVPHLGAGSVSGWAPLIVLETTTGRVASYRVSTQGTGVAGELPPKFDLLELKSLPE